MKQLSQDVQNYNQAYAGDDFCRISDNEEGNGVLFEMIQVKQIKIIAKRIKM